MKDGDEKVSWDDLNACTNATLMGQWRELRHKQEKAL